MAVKDDESTSYVLARYRDDAYAEPVPDRTIGQNVKALRLAAGIKTQRVFAEQMGVEQPRVSDLENDRYEWPEIPTLMLAAQAIGCRVDDFLTGVDADFDTRIAANAPVTPLRRTLTLSGRKAVRLIHGMSAAGQIVAWKAIAGFANAYPLPPEPSQESQQPQARKHQATTSTTRGTR